MERRIYGIMKNGARIFLGAAELTDEEAMKFLDGIAKQFRIGESGSFNIKMNVYDIRSFAGIQIGGSIFEEDE